MPRVFAVSICTFVRVKQVIVVPAPLECEGGVPRVFAVSICTFVPVKQVNVAPAPLECEGGVPRVFAVVCHFVIAVFCVIVRFA